MEGAYTHEKKTKCKMKNLKFKAILYIFLLIGLAQVCIATDISDVFCEDVIKIGSNCTMHTPSISCTVYDYDIINISDGEYIAKDEPLTKINNDFDNYKLNFTNITEPGNYVIRLCDGSVRGIIVEEGAEKEMIIAILILLPLIVSIICLFGAATLSAEEHNALKIFLFLFSVVPFFISMHISVMALIKFYDFPELESLYGSIVYWVALIFGVIVTYFLLYFLYVLFTGMAEKKKKKSEMRY